MKKKFEVINPKQTFNMVFYLTLVLIVVTCVINAIANGVEIAMFVCFSLLLLPMIIAYIWMNMYKVMVDGDKITVRRGIGIKYTIDVSEIERINWKIVHNKFTQKEPMDTVNPKANIVHNVMANNYADNKGNENVIIRTKNRRFSVSTVMIGFSKISKYLKENVDESKIIVKEINK